MKYVYQIFRPLQVFWLFFRMIPIMISLVRDGATAKQWYIEIGQIFLRQGCHVQVGQPKTIQFRSGKTIRRYITNLHYDFRNNRINHTWGRDPVPGHTEKFLK